MGYCQRLEQRVDNLVGDRGLTKKAMFGGIGYFRQGNMCFGIYKDYLIVRLGAAEAAASYLARDHVRPLDITGRQMKGWVMVAPPMCRGRGGLQEWLSLGDQFARSLPPK